MTEASEAPSTAAAAPPAAPVPDAEESADDYAGNPFNDDAALAEMRTFVSRSARALHDLEAKPGGSAAEDAGGDDDNGGGRGGGRARGKKPGRGARTRVQPGPSLD